MSTKSTRPTGNVSRPDQDFWVVLARQGMAGLSGLVHEKCPAAPRQPRTERGDRSWARPHCTALPHSWHQHQGCSQHSRFGWKVSQSNCGAGSVCDWRQEACHRVCMCPPCQRCQHCHVPCFETRQHEDRTRGHTPPAPGSSGEAGPGNLGESYL